ncbi:P-loop NTPase, partial [bacterium]|nr:P-loop NTPase [bacterium]
MPDRSAVTSVVEAVVDPDLRRPIGDAGMVRSVDVSPTGEVKIELAVPAPPWPGHDLGPAIAAAAKSIDGVGEVSIDVLIMDGTEQEALAVQLTEGRPDLPGGVGSSTRVITIASGKGGVGKSSVTANTAVALDRAGHDVAVIDADVWGFSIPKMLGMEHPPMAIGELIIPPRAHGVRAISMDFFVGPDQAVVWRGPMLHKALQQFLSDVYWDEPEFLLIDMPPGTGDVAISLSQFLPRSQTVVVTTPQPTAQRVARRAA